MMRSMYACLSGLSAHQTKMDVIGNNIANVNTIAYKSSRATFQEVFSQTLRGASAPDTALGRGGTNPMQVGLGINVGSIDTITTRGGYQRTDNPTDLYIDGDGFFIVKASNSDTYKFTRAGNFTYDELGNLVTGSGYCVYGWLDYEVDGNGNYVFDTNKPVEAINLYFDNYNGNKQIIAAKATENISLAGNLDATNSVVGDTDPAQVFVPVNVYDSLGNRYEITIEFKKIAATGGETTWSWSIPNGNLAAGGASGTIRFGADGRIIKNAGEDKVTATVTLQHNDSIGSRDFDVVIDFTNITMFAGSDENSVDAKIVDGYPSGSLVSFSIGSDGIIMGVYSNGKQLPLGLIAIAKFDNPAGLQRAGDNMYVATANSGDFSNGLKPGMSGAGTLMAGVLEMSNVDLAKEFTEMIVTQRGFQANSRTLTAVDEMLQELVNMKR